MALKTITTIMYTFLLALISVFACGDENYGPSVNASIDPGNDPNFTFHNNPRLGSFNRKVVVFGIDIYAVAAVEKSKLLHAANVMAQYLDNDEDGNVDDQAVLDKMTENKAFLVMWSRESDLNIDPPSDRIGQDLGNDETTPSYVDNGKTGRFDASLEEVRHIINNAGHSFTYPQVFGQNQGSD